MVNRLLCVVIGYVFGCIQNAYLIGRWKYKIDIREHGSGNAGATNVMRVMGTKVGILTLALDALKGVAAVAAAALLFGYDAKHMLLWAGIGAILGHNFPFYLKFRGGKGVATTLGVFFAVDIRILVIAGIPSLILLYAKRYMSLASLTYMFLMTVVTAVLYIGKPQGLEVLLLTCVFSGASFWRHRANIIRLKKHEEAKIGQKAKDSVK